jgi:hypothetical protein
MSAAWRSTVDMKDERCKRGRKEEEDISITSSKCEDVCR